MIILTEVLKFPNYNFTHYQLKIFYKHALPE